MDAYVAQSPERMDLESRELLPRLSTSTLSDCRWMDIILGKGFEGQGHCLFVQLSRLWLEV